MALATSLVPACLLLSLKVGSGSQNRGPGAGEGAVLLSAFGSVATLLLLIVSLALGAASTRSGKIIAALALVALVLGWLAVLF